MKKWMSRIKDWVCRMIVIVAMLLGIGGMPGMAGAQCVPENDNILRVDVNTPAALQDQDGQSWGCAYESLQQALDDPNFGAGETFDTIWVAAGTYKPSVENNLNNEGGTDDRRWTFTIPPGTAVLGGFDGSETLASQADPFTNITILSGDLGTVDVTSDNAYHVIVIIGSGAVELNDVLIDGFTITGGNADGTALNEYGGGVHLYDDAMPQHVATPTFRRCIFINNHADVTGGAMQLRKSGAMLRDCEFRNNTTGGAGYDEYEGGAAVVASGPVRAINTKFVMNISDENGGGAISNTIGNTTIVKCEFYGNSAAYGGAVYSNGGDVVCSLFAGNQATNGSGGGLFGGTAHGCTFADNYASNLGGGAASLTGATNSIFWGNDADGSTTFPYRRQLDISCTLFKDSGGTSRYNLIQDWECPGGQTCCGPATGCDCITTFLEGDLDPLFVDPGAPDDDPDTFEFNNYRVRYDLSSPAIDAGDPDIEPFDGNFYFPLDDFDADDDLEDLEVTPALLDDRVLNERIDLGSYERPCILPGCVGDCASEDKNQNFGPPPDGFVDGIDLAYVLGEWGNGPGSPADMVDSVTFQPPPDGTVDGADLAAVLGNWGLCACGDPYTSSLMGGGSGGAYDVGSNPFEGTDLGDLLDDAMHNDSEAAAEALALLLELMGW